MPKRIDIETVAASRGCDPYNTADQPHMIAAVNKFRRPSYTVAFVFTTEDILKAAPAKLTEAQQRAFQNMMQKQYGSDALLNQLRPQI